MNTPNLTGKVITWTYPKEVGHYRVIWTRPELLANGDVLAAAVRESDGVLLGDKAGRARTFQVSVAGNGEATPRCHGPAILAATPDLEAIEGALRDLDGNGPDTRAAEALADFLGEELDKRDDEPPADSPSLQDSHPSAGHMAGYGS